jgi:hypothetical protein
LAWDTPRLAHRKHTRKPSSARASSIDSEQQLQGFLYSKLTMQLLWAKYIKSQAKLVFLKIGQK